MSVQNYLVGDTEVLDATISNLSTLILSSNQLSCNAIRLDGASKLAEGRITITTTATMNNAEGIPFRLPHRHLVYQQADSTTLETRHSRQSVLMWHQIQL